MAQFKEKAVTQAAAVLLQLEGGKMNYMKLLKLLYMADRKSLLESGAQFTDDRMVAMDNGPLLSRTYDLIKEGSKALKDGYWCDHIVTSGYDAYLQADPGNEELSEDTETRLEQVYAELGMKAEGELSEWTHDPANVPEWKHPNGSSLTITPGDILRTAFDEATARKRESDIAEAEGVRNLVGI
ncbi:MAG: SocA family protein [Fimbriimonadaceae bacterium]|nr:SocA family protein [Fimbriimonadaceae bacterium]